MSFSRNEQTGTTSPLNQAGSGLNQSEITALIKATLTACVTKQYGEADDQPVELIRPEFVSPHGPEFSRPEERLTTTRAAIHAQTKFCSDEEKNLCCALDENQLLLGGKKPWAEIKAMLASKASPREGTNYMDYMNEQVRCGIDCWDQGKPLPVKIDAEDFMQTLLEKYREAMAAKSRTAAK